MSTKTVQKEGKKRKLTPKRERFCQEYLIDFNITAAAKRAGYTARSAYQTGWIMLKDAEIQNRIIELRTETANKFNITKESILKELMDIKAARIEHILDPETGSVLPVHLWPDHMKGAVGSLDLDELYSGRGEDREPVGVVKKIKLWEKNKAIEILNKMLGFNAPDKVAQTTPDGQAVIPTINVYTVPPKIDNDD